MKIANRDTRHYVIELKPFKANNIFAENRGLLYVVYSYGYHWPLYVFDRRLERWFANADKYSPTTSRHKSQARPDVSQFTDLTSSAIKNYVNDLGVVA